MPMNGTHSYALELEWIGNNGSGTSSYGAYGRDNETRSAGKPAIAGSSDPAFRGDPKRWNPEELLVASLSQCHMLWFLHLSAMAGVDVTAYVDTPVGSMRENPDGSGQFTEVLLRPVVTVAEAAMCERAASLHDDAEKMCFIARSVNFPVCHEPVTVVESD
jgi:organic hydroperoxide reductase OsmC/OhrA